MRINNVSFYDNANYGNSIQGIPASGASDVHGVEASGSATETCSTCANRKYVDGSSEMNVSFKTPGHISAGASKAMVSSHEQEHVANARAEGSKENKELVSATVRIRMAKCPECGVSYAAGGETTTVMRTTTPTYQANNPYSQRQKAIDADRLTGKNVAIES